jgi:polyribonucleotide nucleotidyltransferase
VLTEGQEVKVKVLGIDDRGKVRLSMRLVDQTTGEELPDTRPPREGGDDRAPRGDRGPRRDGGGRDDRGPRRDDRGPRREGGDRAPRSDDRGPRPERAPREDAPETGGSLPDFLTGGRD